MQENREWPRLTGVIRSKAGSIAGFDYSTELKNSGMIWNEVTLAKQLSGTDRIVPDTTMDFYVPKAQGRLDLIAYLQR
jgi:cytochrome c